MDYEQTTIVPKEAVWIFLSAQTELRHLNDIVLGVDSLKKIGVPQSNIYIFADQMRTSLELAVYGITDNIYKTSEFTEEKLKTIENEYAFAIVTGHGSELGLPLSPPISLTPHEFNLRLRSIKNLKTAISIMGQCYAGIFNFVEAYSDPKLVVLGGTNLNLSLSLQVSITPPIPGKMTEINEKGEEVEVDKNLDIWAANTFLYYFFEWIRHHVDIDGDGKNTVMDLYKYAGAKASDELRKSKSELVNEIKMDESTQLASLVKMKNEKDTKESTQMLVDIHAAQTYLNNKLEILYNHQEPWILNSNYARVIELN